MSQCIVENCHNEGEKKKLAFSVSGTKHTYSLYAQGVLICPTCQEMCKETGKGGLLVNDFQWENISKLPASRDGSYRSPVKLLKMAFRKPNQPKSAFLREMEA